MCLGIPMQIQEIDGNVATAAVSGTARKIYLDVLDEEAKVGDYVIVHAGFAIHKIDEEEAKETLRLFEDAGMFDPLQEGDESP
jgi:hydrogenase expression/formation protein HypC